MNMILEVNGVRRLRVACAALVLAASAAWAPVQAKDAVMSFSFNGQVYEHRWSENGQNEFTPVGQEDLAKWTEMVTITVLPKVVDGDTLANTANNVLGLYDERGQVLATDSVPATDEAPAQHFVLAVLGNADLLEANFARMMIVDGMGVSVVAAHRIYGAKPAEEMNTWVQEHAPALQQTLMSWDGMPPMKALRAL